MEQPVFEGVEKRVQLSFSAGSDTKGLRGLSRTVIDHMLSMCGCQVIQSTHNEHFDSYVLSESSLFVYNHEVILKTCGTTQPLFGVTLLVSEAARLGLSPIDLRYSHKNFLFPDKQPGCLANIDVEMAYLKEGSDLYCGGEVELIGDAEDHLLVYTKHFSTCPTSPELSDDASTADSGSPRSCKSFSCDILLFGLDDKVGNLFFQSPINDRRSMEGLIASLLPDQFEEISSVAFEPCGFSANAAASDRYLTVHITPESAFSFASFEVGKTEE